MPGWLGDSYDRISAPHAAMGAPALERLELRGDERVLDAGCGSGRLPEALIERPYLRPATGLPDEELFPMAGAIADRLGALAIDYVRLNVTARRR